MKRKLISIILCVAMLIPCASFVTFADTATEGAQSGNVLYYQQFGKNDNGDKIVNELSDAGLTPYTTSYGSCKISDDGYLNGWMTNNRNMSLVSLPDVVPTHNTYTVELTYRYTTRMNNTKNTNYTDIRDSSGVLIGFSEVTASGSFVRTNKVGTLYNSDEDNLIKFDYSSEDYQAVKAAWKVTEDTTDSDDEYGEWVTMKLSVENDYLYSIELSCGTATWKSNTFVDTYEKPKLNTDLIYIVSYQSGFDIASIRIVEGVDYTEYTGNFAVESYSGYGPMVHTRGAQLGISDETENMARLVGQIRGTGFTEAGFLVEITNDGVGSGVKKLPVTTAYISLLEEDGVITPSYSEESDYYLIATKIQLTDAPNTSVSTTNLKITFRPYAVDANGNTYYGNTYDFNCINKVTTRASAQLEVPNA